MDKFDKDKFGAKTGAAGKFSTPDAKGGFDKGGFDKAGASKGGFDKGGFDKGGFDKAAAEKSRLQKEAASGGGFGQAQSVDKAALERKMAAQMGGTSEEVDYSQYQSMMSSEDPGQYETPVGPDQFAQSESTEAAPAEPVNQVVRVTETPARAQSGAVRSGGMGCLPIIVLGAILGFFFKVCF